MQFIRIKQPLITNWGLFDIPNYMYLKGPLFFQFNQFLDSRAEIHQIFELFFFGKKAILKFK